MKYQRQAITWISALILCLSVALLPVQAQSRGAQFQRVQAPAVKISRDEAAAIARDATGGRVLKVQLNGGGRPVYRVKVLVAAERVRVIRIDATSGRLLN